MRERRAPSGSACRVRSQDMVVGQNMSISQSFGGLGVIPYHRGVRTDFRLRKDHADAHGFLLFVRGTKLSIFRSLSRPLPFVKGMRKLSSTGTMASLTCICDPVPYSHRRRQI